MKLKKLKILLLLCFVFSLKIVCFASLDIGEEVFVKSYFNTKANDVQDASLVKETNTLQRLRIYVKGNIQQNIEAKVQIQSLGMWGASTDTVKINDYYFNNFSPFLEHAYIKANGIFNIGKLMKFNLIIGKQPMFYGDGFVLSDNNRGVFAYKLEGIGSKFCDLDLWSINEPASSINAGKENLDLNVYAGILKLDKFFYKRKATTKISPSVYFVSEDNKTIKTINDKKNFVGVRVDGNSEDSLFFNLEVTKLFGDVKTSTSTQKYNGLFYDARAKLKIVDGLFKDSMFVLDYLEATGTDDLSGKLENGNFEPFFANKNNEQDNVCYGEIFSRIYPGLNNKKIITTGLEYNKINGLKMKLYYYSYWKISDGKFLGNEIDFTVKKTINDFINTRFIFSVYQKTKEVKVLKDEVNQFSLEFDYKF
jgi:hypothetical protein